MKYRIKIYDHTKDITNMLVNRPMRLIEFYVNSLNLKIIIEKIQR